MEVLSALGRFIPDSVITRLYPENVINVVRPKVDLDAADH